MNWPVVFAGLRHGVLVWWAYAVLEYLLSSAVPLLQSDSMLPPWHARVSGFVFGIYLVTGVVFGALAGLAAILSGGPADVRERRAEVFAALTLPLCFVLNLQTASPPWYSTVLYGVLVIGLLAALWTDRLSFLRGPWVVNLLFAGSSWIVLDLLDGRSRVLRLMAMAGAVALVIAFAARVSSAWSRRTTLATLGMVSLSAIAVMAFFGDRSPIQAASPAAASAGRPNLVMIVLDTVRADHMSVYGYERKTTPKLETFARAATLYRNAIATSDVTLSTHASLFTGLYPSFHGAHYTGEAAWQGVPLDSRVETLAETLSKSGYATASIAANYGYLGPHFGLQQGFAQSDTRAPVLLINGSKRFFLRDRVRRLLAWAFPSREFDRQTRMGEEITGDALRFLEPFRGGKGPFFLFLNYMDAHSPYVPPAPYDTMFPGLDSMFTHPKFNAMAEEVMREKRPIRDAERNHIISQYDGAIAYLDKQVGDILNRLKEWDLAGNTLVIVTSDHGEAVGDRFLLEHGGVSAYQEHVRVPLLIRYPGGQSQGLVVDETVSQVDVMPTSLAVLGLKGPARTQGFDLRNVDSLRDRRVYTECFASKLLRPLHPKFNRDVRAVYAGGVKFIHPTAGPREMYRLAEDPQEQRNVFRAEDPLASSLKDNLTDWMKAARLVRGTSSGAPTALDKETLERLRSLGYVQ